MARRNSEVSEGIRGEDSGIADTITSDQETADAAPIEGSTTDYPNRSERGASSSAASNDTQTRENFVFLEAVDETPKKGRSKRASKPKSVEKIDAAPTALIFLTLFEVLAVAYAGENAKLLPHEKACIEGPLTRTLSRFGNSTLQKMEKYSDFVMLAWGFGMWGVRISQVAKEKKSRENARATAPASAPTTAPRPLREETRSNGATYPQGFVGGPVASGKVDPNLFGVARESLHDAN